MNKGYQKPDVEYVSLIAREDVTTLKGSDILDGEMSTESSEFD